MKLKELESLLDKDDHKFINNSKNILPKINITNISKTTSAINTNSKNTKKMKRKQTPTSLTLNKKINKTKNDIQISDKLSVLPQGHKLAKIKYDS